MTDEFAHVWAIHKERSSGRIAQIDVEVRYVGRALHLPIHLIPPIDGQESRGSIIARELVALGEALIRIAQQPESVIDENPPTRIIETSDRRK
jgi:hypothetical protein